MADELNTPSHRWYEPRNNIALAPKDYSRHYIYDSGIQKIDAWINGGTPPEPTFSPSTLFAASEPGVWYDPSDLTTLFQDTAGTIPVTTPGQTVALALDKSRGLVLGPELVANGDFSGGSTGWALGTGWSVSSGAAVATSVASGLSIAQDAGLVAGRFYRLTLTIGALSSGGIRPYAGSGGSYGTTISASGTYSWTLLASGNSTIYIATAGTTTLTIDNISVRELPGNHATQATAASRPVYGIEPVGGRRNLLTWSEGFDSAAWNLYSGMAPTATNTTDPLGGTTAEVFTWTSGTSSRYRFQSVTLPAVGTYTYSVWLRAQSGTVSVAMAQRDFAGLTQAVSIKTATTDWQRFSYTFSPPSGLVGSIGIDQREAAATQNGTVEIWGAQIETGSTATAYQRVTTQYDVTEAGKASVPYLYDDLVGDALNWTATAGTYSIAFVNTLGDVTIQTSQSLSGATDALSVQKLAGYLAINRALTTAETASLTAWFRAKAGI